MNQTKAEGLSSSTWKVKGNLHSKNALGTFAKDIIYEILPAASTLQFPGQALGGASLF
jgi:hypothetical protein